MNSWCKRLEKNESKNKFLGLVTEKSGRLKTVVMGANKTSYWTSNITESVRESTQMYQYQILAMEGYNRKCVQKIPDNPSMVFESSSS
jgi:hypothetical protein